MTDISTLETELLPAIAAANDEAALEAVRVAALGKNGSVSALLKTLGTMTPDQRKEQGPLINGLKDRVTAAIATLSSASRRSLRPRTRPPKCTRSSGRRLHGWRCCRR